MHDFIRLALLLAIAAAAITLAGSAVAFFLEETRRLTRIAWRVLGGQPDGVIVAQGRDAAAAFSVASNQMLVMRDGGGNALIYKLSLLRGAELIIDDQVVARVAAGEPRRTMDRLPKEAEQVVFRLFFDDVRHPEFTLDLWLPSDASRRNARTVVEVLKEARAWIGRAEAILRRSGPALKIGDATVDRERMAPTPLAFPDPTPFPDEGPEGDEFYDDEIHAEAPSADDAPFESDEPEAEQEFEDDGDPFTEAPVRAADLSPVPRSAKQTSAKTPEAAKSDQLPLF